MADNLISKVKLGSAIYHLKDEEARAAVNALQTAVASSLIFKGVVSSATEITVLKDYKVGWTYKASARFEVADLGKIEPGDMIICISAYNSGYKASDWTVVQNNIDVMEGASNSADGASGLVPAPTAGDQGKFLKGDGTWSEDVVTIDGDQTISGSKTFSNDVSVGRSLIQANGYITGTWLKTTAASNLPNAPRVAVMTNDGWIYSKPMSDFLTSESISWGKFSDLIG